MPFNFPARLKLGVVTGLLALVLFSHAAAQTATGERWLLIFDTSAAMKKWQAGTEAEIKGLLAAQISGQLQPGDSIGVWTFGRELHTGQFPLMTWNPDQAAATASNLIAFFHRQNFTGDTTWPVLQPVLGQLIKNSHRLTIVIFCDGLGQVDWTPYNDGINRTFSQTMPDRKKARQPFVLVVRTQQGQFTGCTVNFPPGALNVPPFPPLPEPPKIIPTNPPVPVAAVVKPPVPVLPPLVIVGTNVGTNLNDLPKITPAPITNLPVMPAAPANILAATNRTDILSNTPPAAPDFKTAEVKNLPPVASPVIVPPTNNVMAASLPTEPDRRRGTLIYATAGACVVGVLTIIFLWARAVRRPRGSLITSSMQSDPRLPPRT